MTADNRKVFVSEKGYRLALSRDEGDSSWKKRLGLVLGGNASKAFTFQLSNDLAPLLDEGCGCWKPDPTKRGWLLIIVRLISVRLTELRNIFMLTALRNDPTDSHSDFRSPPQALSLKC